jgi:hypothetical protein
MSNKFQLLITSFVSFIGHYIDRHSNCGFWLSHLYLLMDITLAVLHIPASDYLICIFYWTLHWRFFKFQLLRSANVMSNKRYKWGNQKLEFEERPMSCPIKDTNEVIRSYNLLDITLAVIQIPASDYLICIFYWTLHWPSFKFQLLFTSFVSFIGHNIGRCSNCSFWGNCRQKLEFEWRPR